MEILDWMFYGNSARTWGLAALGAVATYALLYVGRAVVLRSLEHLARRTKSGFDDVVAEGLRALRPWFTVAASMWMAAQLLVLPPRVDEVLDQGIILLLLLQMGVSFAAAIRLHVKVYTARRAVDDPSSVTTMRAIGFLGTVVLWGVLALMALDNIGIEITALVAGLGIGGIAVALALQNILGDLFASLSIVLDKPFVYGDFIVVGEMAGTVENVGLKTTRVRSLSGEQLVFSYSDLLQSRIRNYKRMQERRILLPIGVVYQTSPADLARIPQIVREAVEAQPDVRFERAHLKSFGASSLDFEVIYHVLSADFNLYMDRQQAINLRIFERFDTEGIEFAYPTQTLYIPEGVGIGGRAGGWQSGNEE